MKLHSVEDAIEWFISNPEPRLTFLDIQLMMYYPFEIFETARLSSVILLQPMMNTLFKLLS